MISHALKEREQPNAQNGRHLIDDPSADPNTSYRIRPPVMKATLSELDIHKIIHNHRLRHDINFDHNLQFRSHLDGEKGRRKRVKVEQFWVILRDQLQEFVATPGPFQKHFGQDWCLSVLLKEAKDIFRTLLPPRDRVYLDEGFNVELITQQFYNGCADLEKLTSWLSTVLKTHCAPMRDELVDNMYDKLTSGNRMSDT